VSRANSKEKPCAVFAVGFAGLAQVTKPSLDARDLYLERVGASEVSTAAPAKGATPKESRDLKKSQQTNGDARSLGIRYNVLLVDAKNGLPQPVDPERTFQTGDCIALELQANRSGHLYILTEGTSHEWAALFPSDLDSSETTVVSSGVRTRAPAKNCLEFTNPPGTERLFLILLQDPADVKELVRLYRMSSVATPTAASSAAMEKLQDRFASRDLKIKKVQQPEAPDERPFITYAVAQASRLFIEIKLRHQ
jgi:hypothetical protein